MASFFDKTTDELEGEIRQLEEKASKQQSSASSYEQALRQTQSVLAEAYRNQNLQQTHFQRLQSDIKLKSDSAYHARQAAAARRQELRRRIQEDEEEKEERLKRQERQQFFLNLHNFEIKALVERLKHDSRVMKSVQTLTTDSWTIDDIQRIQSMLWEVLSGAGNRYVIDLATTFNDIVRAEEEEVVVVSVRSVDSEAGIVQKGGGEVDSPDTLTPPSVLTSESILERNEFHHDHNRSTVSEHSLNLHQRRNKRAPNPHSYQQRNSRSPNLGSRLKSSVSDTGVLLSRWDLLPPSKSKRPRIVRGGDFFSVQHDSSICRSTSE